jgi:periplasmic divalent cation tolerance protein
MRLAHLAVNDKPVLIYATFPDATSAEEAGRHAVEAGLAACVNILPGMVSLYRWQGQLHRDSECVLIIKTRSGLAERVIAEGRARHPYDNPAFLILEVAGGSEAYIAWLMASVPTQP